MAEALRSMTGSGRATRDTERGRIDAEARSVNHRFLKTSVRTQGALPPLDREIEDCVRARTSRGHVSLFVRWTPALASVASRVDAQRFEAAATQLTQLADLHELEAPTVSDVLRVPGVLADDAPAEDAQDALAEAALEAVTKALDQWRESREREGALLGDELRALLTQIDELRLRSEVLSEQVPARVAQRLRERIAALLEGSGVEPDSAQIARECALLADRSDVREELARLAAHVTHARELLEEGGPVGRRLDFLMQELAREANTLSVKASELDLGRLALDLKTAVERLREQVQNVE